MAPSQLALGPLGEVQSLDDRSTSIRHGWIARTLAQAIDDTGPRKQAALDMGIDQSQLTRLLKGIGHLPLDRIERLPDDTILAFANALRHAIRAETDVERLDRTLCALVSGLYVLGDITRQAIQREAQR